MNLSLLFKRILLLTVIFILSFTAVACTETKVPADTTATETTAPDTTVEDTTEADKEPQALQMLHDKQIDLVVNIPKNLTAAELSNGYKIRRAAIDFNIPLITNARLADAFIHAFCSMSEDEIQIKSWDEYK